MEIIKTTTRVDGADKSVRYSLYLSHWEMVCLYTMLQAVSVKDPDPELEKLRLQFLDQIISNDLVRNMLHNLTTQIITAL